jgi:hypothetical protein
VDLPHQLSPCFTANQMESRQKAGGGKFRQISSLPAFGVPQF